MNLIGIQLPVRLGCCLWSHWGSSLGVGSDPHTLTHRSLSLLASLSATPSISRLDSFFNAHTHKWSLGWGNTPSPPDWRTGGLESAWCAGPFHTRFLLGSLNAPPPELSSGWPPPDARRSSSDGHTAATRSARVARRTAWKSQRHDRVSERFHRGIFKTF